MNYNFFQNQYSEEELREYIENNPGNLGNWLWEGISIHQNLSEDFIRDFQHKVHWGWISGCQNLSEEFLIEHLEKVDIDFLKPNQKIPEDVKERIINLKKVLEMG